MYNQGHQQNVFMNGGHGPQRYGMQMNPSKPYQNHNQQGHGQHMHQQDHGDHGSYNHHQHNSSSGFSSGAGQFNPSQYRGGTPTQLQNGSGKGNEHLQIQMSMARQARENTGSHVHARNHPQATRGQSSLGSDSIRKDTEREERNRASKPNERDRQGWYELDMSGQGLRAISVHLFQYAFLEKLFLNRNKLTSIPPGIGTLRNLVHLDLSHNLLQELPPEIGMLSNLKELWLFDNHLLDLPDELGSLYQLELLGLEGNNALPPHRTSILAQDGTKALITVLREEALTPEAPRDRDWITIEGSRQSDNASDTFRVLSYNILCDHYATQSMYGYTPRRVLSWEHRRDTILLELQNPTDGRSADIMCLQEVETESYHEFFRTALAHNDYKGVFHPKSRSRTMNEKEAKMVDGCATFYKNSKFILLDKQWIEFKNAINRPDMKGSSDIFNRVMPKDNIATVVFLENRATGARVMVVNTHLHWDPAFEDVKVVQSTILLEFMADLAEKYAKWPPTPIKDKVLYRFADSDDDNKPPQEPMPEPGPSQEYASGKQIPVILCGDFNSTPESGVHELLSTGDIEPTHPDLGSYKYGNITRDGAHHPFSLKSAYGAIGELPFTNYTPDFQNVIEYIWYSANVFQVKGLLGQVDPEYLQRVPGFPNHHFPSDHLALLAEFVISNPKKAGQNQDKSSSTNPGSGIDKDKVDKS